MNKPVELPKRGGAHTFEDLEREALGQQAANVSTLSGADMTAAREDATKADTGTAKPDALKRPVA